MDGVSFSILRGETLGVVGESGSGKSTLGVLFSDSLIRLKEMLFLIDVDISHLSQRKIRPQRKDMQIVFQDPFASLNSKMSVGQLSRRTINCTRDFIKG